MQGAAWVAADKAREAVEAAAAAEAVQRQDAKLLYRAFKTGTATPEQVQKGLAYLTRQEFRSRGVNVNNG